MGDVVTVRIVLSLEARGGGKLHGLPTAAHAPLLPQPKPESWAVALTTVGGGAVVGLKLAPPLREWSVEHASGRPSWCACALACDAAALPCMQPAHSDRADVAANPPPSPLVPR